MRKVYAVFKFKNDISEDDIKEISNVFRDVECRDENIYIVRHVPNPITDMVGTADKIIEFINSFADRAEIQIKS